MYQVIYIEIDEEITSIIEKLRNTRTKEVFLSVPSRALILQSIVSLKLLRKEADKLDRTVIIVTGDAKEQRLVEKAGIGIKESLEGMDAEGEVKEAVMPRINEKAPEKIPEPGKSKVRQTSERIGSPDFYDITEETGALPDWEKVELPPAPKRMMVEVSRETKRAEKNMNPDFPPQEEERVSPDEPPAPAFDSRQSALVEDFIQERRTAPSRPQYSPKKPLAQTDRIPVSKKIIRTLFSLLLLALVVFALAAAYLFIPRAEVRMALRSRSLEKELELRGETARQSLDASALVVPLRLAEREEKYFFSYPVTGKGTSQGQKARGTVTLYNEYSAEPQPLVATTRLISPDKKIFRLVKGVTVPGMKEVGGQSQPGAIEAEVIADETGESYNIEPATFNIPGFEGSPKYDKFYAKSSAKMTGGSAVGAGTGGGTTVTETDIASAKSKSETQAKVKIWEDLKVSLGEGELVFPNAAEQTIIESASLSRKGDTVSEFQYQVSIRVKALVLDGEDVLKVFRYSFGSEAGNSDVQLDFGAVSGDLSAGTAVIRAHGQLRLSQEIDAEKFKREIAGKRVSEIQEIIKDYPQIEEVELDVEPSLLFEKVPQIPSRIEIIIVPSGNKQGN